METKTKPAARLLKAASQLFFDQGFAVGIDPIIAAADVAKMSLYQHYKNRDGLETAVINAARDQMLIAPDSPTPSGATDLLLMIVEFLCKRSSDPTIRGSLPFQALATYPLPNNASHRAGVDACVRIKEWLETECRAAGFQNPTKIAAKLLHAVLGHYLAVKITGPNIALETTMDIVRNIIAAAPVAPTPALQKSIRPSKGAGRKVTAFRVTDEELDEIAENATRGQPVRKVGQP